VEQLTEEEKLVLERLARGGNVEEMAAKLAMSPDTVRGHVQSILKKLQVHSRLEAVGRRRGSGEPTQDGGYVFWERPTILRRRSRPSVPTAFAFGR